MSPQSNDTSGLSLPAPSLEAQHPAMASPQPTLTPQQTIGGYAPQPPITPAVSDSVVQQPAPVVQTAPMGTPMPTAQPQQAPLEDDVAEDDDELDAEWIAKAKAIVEQLRLDPFAESNAFSEIKAEYMQRRHGKTIKVK